MSQMPPQGGPPQGPPPGLPPQLLAMLSHGHPDPGEASEPQDELSVLQEIIQELPRLIATLKDPRDTENAITCLKVLAGIQTRLMGQGQGAAAQPPR